MHQNSPCMMKIWLNFVYFILLNFVRECELAQPYFPPQVVFSYDNDQTIIAIDEINQQAYMRFKYGATGEETSFVMKHFPYAIPDSPESKYYVQLLVDAPSLTCRYGTYWKYGWGPSNSYPPHWVNGSSFEIKNYLQFNSEMIHSKSAPNDEDYWYANRTCTVESGETYPCEEIYFKKDTDIPLRLTRVVRQGWELIQEKFNYQIISMKKPDEKYFDSIPQNWSIACLDLMLGPLFDPQSAILDLNQNVQIHVWLLTPPHRIDGNDTVIIQWKASPTSDCLTWSPKQLSFNSRNFQETQTLTITRVKNGSMTTLIPIFTGGGFDLLKPDLYPIHIE